MQLSRAVARRDARTARKALAALPDAADSVEVHDGVISVVDQAKLDTIIADILRSALRRDIADDYDRRDDKHRGQRPRRRRPILDVLTKL